MALRIEKAYGVSMDTLPHMGAWCDSRAMCSPADEIRVKILPVCPETEDNSPITFGFEIWKNYVKFLIGVTRFCSSARVFRRGRAFPRGLTQSRS